MSNSKQLQAIVEIAGSLSPTLTSTIKEATGRLESINVKALAIGAAVGGIAVATGAAVIKGSKYLEELGSQFDEATDTVRIGTGATGKSLDALMSDFDEVYKNVPTTMEYASKAIADYNTRLGLTGVPLQEISEQALQVSDMLGDDLNGVIKGSSEAFQAWNINAKNMGNAMDFVFKVSQSTGIGFTDLMTKVQQFAPQLQEMGYSFDDATALIGQMEKAGVQTDEVLAAMKKSVGTLAKEGYSASEGLQIYYEKIQDAGSAAEATTIANEIFGARAGSTVAAAIRNGTLAVDDFTKSLQDNGETISGAADDTYNFAERMQMMKQKVQVALKPVANTMFDSIDGVMPAIEDSLNDAIPLLQEVAANVGPFVKNAIPKVIAGLSWIKDNWSFIATGVGAIGTGFATFKAVSLVETAVNVFKNMKKAEEGAVVAQEALNMAQKASPIGMIISLVAALVAGIVILWNTNEGFRDAVLNVLNTIGGAVSTVVNGVINFFTVTIPEALMSFQGFWAGVWQGVVDTFASIMGTLGGVFKAPLNGVIRMLNWFISKIDTISIKLPDWSILGEYAGADVGFHFDQIDYLAKGGFTDGLSIAGEAGTEAVISFLPSVRQQNIETWQQAGEMLGVDSYSSRAGKLLSLDDFSLSEMSGSVVNIYNDFSNFTWSPTIECTGSEEDKGNILDRLKSYENEFMDWLDEFVRMRESSCYSN